MIVSYDNSQKLVSPDRSFDVVTELYPGGESAIHIHPQQDEIYEVKEGEMQVYLDKDWRTLKSGERVTIPKGTITWFQKYRRAKSYCLQQPQSRIKVRRNA
jgi:quercetin dioxygenase-like cupin family protein